MADERGSVSPYIWSQVRRRPLRAFWVVLGVALGAALFVSLTALGSGFRKAARGPLEKVAAHMMVTRPANGSETDAGAQRARGMRLPFGLSRLSARDVAAIERADGVAAVAPVLQVWDLGGAQATTVVGLDPGETRAGPGRALAHSMVEGRNLRSRERGVAVADLHYARFYGLGSGSTVKVGQRRLRIVGVVELTDTSQAAAANLYVALPEARALAGLSPGEFNQVYVKASSASKVDAITAGLSERLGSLSVTTEDSLLQVIGGVGKVSARFSTSAAVVGLVGGLLLAWFALQALVTERRREIGILKALGWRRCHVNRAFLAESALLCLAGGIFGIALGLGATTLLGQASVSEATLALDRELSSQPGPQRPFLDEHKAGNRIAEARGQGGAREEAPVADRCQHTALPAQVEPLALGAALAAAVGGGALAGWSGARRVSALRPGEILRGL